MGDRGGHSPVDIPDHGRADDEERNPDTVRPRKQPFAHDVRALHRCTDGREQQQFGVHVGRDCADAVFRAGQCGRNLADGSRSQSGERERHQRRTLRCQQPPYRRRFLGNLRPQTAFGPLLHSRGSGGRHKGGRSERGHRPPPFRHSRCHWQDHAGGFREPYGGWRGCQHLDSCHHRQRRCVHTHQCSLLE